MRNPLSATVCKCRRICKAINFTRTQTLVLHPCSDSSQPVRNNKFQQYIPPRKCCK